MVTENKLTNLQLELLKSLKYITDEKQMEDIKSLINFYFQQQLNASIEEVEAERGYTAETYKAWLQQASK